MIKHTLRKLALLSVAILCSTTSTIALAEWHTTQTTRYTTKLELVFWHDESMKAPAQAIADQVLARFDEVDRMMSSYRPDSEVSKLNDGAGKGPVKVSSQLFEVIEHAQTIAALSEGAFDISYASAGYHYDYRAQQKPSDEVLGDAIKKINYRNIKLDKLNSTIELTDAGMRIDLGGIAKGYAVDLGIETLKQAGVKHARLGAGGDLYLLGAKLNEPWVVGIQDPRLDDEQALILPLFDAAVSTSGDYERFFFDESGDRVHHILSPKTGKPAMGIQSVTILGEKAMETDALSTAIFVAGTEKGLAIINQIPLMDAIIIDEIRNVHYSYGLVEPE